MKPRSFFDSLSLGFAKNTLIFNNWFLQISHYQLVIFVLEKCSNLTLIVLKLIKSCDFIIYVISLHKP